MGDLDRLSATFLKCSYTIRLNDIAILQHRKRLISLEVRLSHLDIGYMLLNKKMQEVEVLQKNLYDEMRPAKKFLRPFCDTKTDLSIINWSKWIHISDALSQQMLQFQDLFLKYKNKTCSLAFNTTST